MPQPTPASLLEALLDYEVHVRAMLPQKQADAILAQVRTALWRYTLPSWEFPAPKGQRLSQQEYERGLDFLKQIPLEWLKDAPAAQEQLFEQFAVAGNSRRNYRWALKRFIDWCNQQSWFEAAERTATPRKRSRKGSANDIRLTTRKARRSYRLTEAQSSEALRHELDRFTQFLMQPETNGPDLKGASFQTAKQYRDQVLRILGWLHTQKGVALQELSLRQFVEVRSGSVGLESDGHSLVDHQGMIDLVQAYLQWLSVPAGDALDERHEGVQSPYTAIKVINTWLAVVRFVYHQDGASEWEAKEASAVVASLKELRSQVTAQLHRHRLVSDESKKHLEWTQFLELVEHLRGECISRFPQRTQSKQDGSTPGSRRSVTAIAQSYQRFLLAALLAYIPPQRPQVLRQLLIPHPPLLEQALAPEAVASQDSVLYREQEVWWIKIANRPNNGSSHYLVFVPNLSYADGRCFYQYLEEWLLHYEDKDERGRAVAKQGLRYCFSPQHLRLFTMKNGQPYEEAAAFIKLLRHPGYRVTGQAIDFQSVRRAYLEYVTNQEHPGLGMENPALASTNTATSSASDSLDVEEYEYKPAECQRAAEIAQGFLTQRAESFAG